MPFHKFPQLLSTLSHLRLARLDEIPRINALIKSSAQQLSTGFYTPKQIDSLIKHIFGVDTSLIEDQTYYVIDKDGELVACGGFSRRKTLFGGDQCKEIAHNDSEDFLDPSIDPGNIRAFFVAPRYAGQGFSSILMKAAEAKAQQAGFRSVKLRATLTGVAVYEHLGFTCIGDTSVILPDGEIVQFKDMHKTLATPKLSCR